MYQLSASWRNWMKLIMSKINPSPLVLHHHYHNKFTVSCKTLCSYTSGENLMGNVTSSFINSQRRKPLSECEATGIMPSTIEPHVIWVPEYWKP